MTDSADFPLQQLVLKIHSRCDLACDHCYVYEHADQSWKTRPTVISEETLSQVTRRITEYVKSQGLESFSVILHGGEPLLVGPNRLRKICGEISAALTPITTLDLRIHTNGVQLSNRHLEIFKEFGVKVSISLDGDRAANDRHRRDRRGRSSYERVLRAVRLVQTPEYQHLFSGLLCTVDVANDPVAVHEALTALSPPRIDYLLPHSTWDNPPPSRGVNSPTPYADWLLAVFDRWELQGRKVPVRTFDSVLSTLRGGPSLTEAMGLAPSDLAVVETDGSFEQADSLKTAFDGAAATGYDVSRNGFEEFALHEGVLARQRGLAGVSETCRRCPVVESCGGGLYAHRYRTGHGFDNPSVFCADLRAFIGGAAKRITERSLSAAVTDPGELSFAQLRLDRDLLAQTNERLTGNADWDTVWQALVRLDSDEDSAWHLNRVLAHPYVRTSLRRGGPGADEVARFAAVAVAVAVHARAPLTLAWEQSRPDVHLPTLGTLTAPEAGRVEATVTVDGLLLRMTGGNEYLLAQNPDAWRPLVQLWLPSGEALLIDDSDPYRDAYPVAVAPPLDHNGLISFRERLRTAYELLEERKPGWLTGINAFRATTITPLAAGASLHLGSHGLGALGVAVDFEPMEFARELPRLGRHARLAALRETTDLNVPGNRAGRLLDEAFFALGDAAYWENEEDSRANGRVHALEQANRALDELARLPEQDLTETGAMLAAELRAEWAVCVDSHD